MIRFLADSGLAIPLPGFRNEIQVLEAGPLTDVHLPVVGDGVDDSDLVARCFGVAGCSVAVAHMKANTEAFVFQRRISNYTGRTIALRNL